MAKLSARGRKELARVERETNVEGDALVDWRRVTYALMTDGTILRKNDVRFKADAFRSSPEKHSYGWVVARKVKGMTREAFLAKFAGKDGYVEVRS